MNNTNNNNNPKYLIIVTLVDGQNFTIPDGVPDKIEASVFAEARFGSESVLRSDPIRLVNSNPEFATELAWQLDRKSLHQLRIERRAIKLQVFMQTKSRKKARSQQTTPEDPSLIPSDLNSVSLDATNKIELIGYTIIKIRAAQESEVPKFEWLPLLNPKFRKSSYNRPEVQLALTLTKIDEDNVMSVKQTAKNGIIKGAHLTGGSNSECSDSLPSDLKQDDSLSIESNKLYKTCLDTTPHINPDEYNTGDYDERDEIIENDIQIHSRDGNFYIYDIRNIDKFTIKDCDKSYKIRVRIAFNSDLDLLINHEDLAIDYYFTIYLFGSSIRLKSFENLTSLESNEILINVFTTHSSLLTTYFELNPSLIIKFHHGQTHRILGSADIQVDQLCTLESKRRSIEGIFALQSSSDIEQNPSPIHPTIGVSIVIERTSNGTDVEHKITHDVRDLNGPSSDDNINEHFGEDIDELLYKSFDNTHQLTLNETTVDNCYNSTSITKHQRILHNSNDAICPNTRQALEYDLEQFNTQDQDHHFCFIIDLKNFSYTQNQRLIPILRELVVRYSYPFFGYKDTITTDASIPISPTNSIIVSGFCEFNFATTYESLYAALNEIPLHLNILTCDHLTSKRVLETGLGDDLGNNLNQAERVVATCSLNLAAILELPNDISDVRPIKEPISKTVSAPIYGLKGEDNGQLQVYLCLKDLGKPTYHKNLNDEQETSDQQIKQSQIEPIELNEDYIKDSNQAGQVVDNKSATITKSSNKSSNDQRKLVAFMEEARVKMESWQELTYKKLSDDVKTREDEFMKRVQQKFDLKDTKREQDYKAKMKILNDLEKRFKTSLTAIDSLEKMLRSGFEQLKASDSKLDARLEVIDSKISKALDDIRSIEQKSQSHAGQQSMPTDKDPSRQMQPAPAMQQPSTSIPPAKKLSFYPSKYSRSSEGNLILSANNQEPHLGGLVRKTGQLNNINNNGIARAGSNTRISSGVTVIDLSPGGTRRPSVRQMTTKWSGIGVSGTNGGNVQARTASTTRTVGAGQIPRVK